MRAEIDHPDAGGPHAVRPLTRSLVDTAALDLIDLATPNAPSAGGDAVGPPSFAAGGPAARGMQPQRPGGPDEWRGQVSGSANVSTHTLARSRPVPGTTGTPVIEELWARPTSDIADLVAQVRTQLGVRRLG